MLRFNRLMIVVSLLLAGITAGGCDVVFNLFPTTNNETGKAQLTPFGSEKAFADYLRDQIERQNARMNTLDRQFDEVIAVEESADSGDAGGEAAPSLPGAGATSADDGADAPDFSGTTIQEAGVDEADVVKTDGFYLYVLTTEWPDSVLRIVDVSDPAAMTEVSRITIEGTGQDMYLDGDRVVVITSNNGGFFILDGGVAVEPVFFGEDVADAVDAGEVEGDAGQSLASSPEPDAGQEVDPDVPDDMDREAAPDEDINGFIAPDLRYERPRVSVTVVDVTDRTAPHVASITRFDGAVSSSRMIDGVLHLVAANHQTYYYDVMPLLGAPEFDVQRVDPAEVLPRYTRINADGSESSGEVVTWENLYHPVDPDGFGIVYVVSIDIDAEATFTAVGVVAEPGLIYSSVEALYLTDTEYAFSGDRRTTTDIYKFAYADRGATPVAAGTVPGRILNQYSMGEYQGFLRVATTVDATFGLFGQRTPPTNHVFVLEQQDDVLEIVGSVEGIAPRETIRAARFIGERGFVVTFEQIDPLFTLDLSDPTNPRVVGELKVPGFSTFLVPIDDDHLLAVGQHVPPPGVFGPWGVQLSIFDVSDFADPQLMDQIILGEDTGASSEALYNPKAFTYFAERGLVAFPLSIYEDVFFIDEGDVVIAEPDGDNGDAGAGSDEAEAPPPDDEAVVDSTDDELVETEPFVPGGFEGLVIYSVSLDTGLRELGRISTRFPEAGVYWSSFTRAVFIDDDVLAVTDYGVRGAPVTDISSAPFELLFDRSTDGAEDDDGGASSSGGGSDDGVSTEAPASDQDEES